MPIYEYECEKCETLCEFIQKFSDPPKKKCPHCGGKVHKVMSMNAFHLKGEGWYVTDYKGKNASLGASASSDSADGGKGPEKAEKAEKKEKKEKKAAKKDD